MLSGCKVSREHASISDANALTPSKIRWFYKDEYTKKWTQFNGYDSIMLETYFLKDDNLYLDRSDDGQRKLLVRENLYEVNISERICYPIYWKSSQISTPILRGSWFRDPGGPQCIPIEDELMAAKLEVSHLKICCTDDVKTSKFPYDQYSGATLTEHIPMQSDKSKPYSDFLTIPSIFSTAPALPSLLTLHFSDCFAEWYSLDEIYLYMKSTSLYICQKLGMRRVGTRIGRGYFEDADLEDQPPRISHLCFVVHGMGQKYLQGSIIKSCDELRATSKKLIESYFPDIKASQCRIEFLPVEWRSSLRLDGDIVDSLTLKNLGRLRYFINCTFMDIMYYTSPLYRFEISRSLLLEVNRLYNLFVDLNPYFELNGGRVTMLAHSLGCVIAYDLITGWIDPLSVTPSVFPFDSCCEHLADSSSRSSTETVKVNGSVPTEKDGNESTIRSKLEAAKDLVKCLESQLKSSSSVNNDDIQCAPSPSAVEKLSKRESHMSSRSLVFASRLENLICVGSPLAIYLTLRGVRPGLSTSPDKVMPKSLCTHIYNIFHPSDPVKNFQQHGWNNSAYRLEPLILKHYSSVPPVEIYRCSDPDKISYQVMHRNSFLQKPISMEQESTSSLSDISFASNFSTQSSVAEKVNEISQRNSLELNGRHRSLSFTDLIMGFFWKSNGQQHDSSITHKPSSLPKRLKLGNSSTGDDVHRNRKSSLKHLTHNDSSSSSSCSSSNFETHSPSTFFSDYDTSALHLEYRMDYQLRASRYETPYLSALTVHTSYMSNPDVVMFILMQVFSQSTPVDNSLIAS